MRRSQKVCLISLFLLISSWSIAAATAEGDIYYQMSFAMSENDITTGAPIEVQAHIRLPEARQELCFYLAYNDPLFFYDPNQDLRRNQSLGELHLPGQGRIEIKSASEKLSELMPFLYKIDAHEALQHIDLEFQFVVPRWPGRLGNQFLFHQFYPQILEECPDHNQLTYNWLKAQEVTYQAEVNWPKSWQLTTPHSFVEPRVIRASEPLAFNLSKNYRITTFDMKDLTVQMVYLSDNFSDHERYVRNFVVSLQATIGDFPYQKLLIIETEDLERSRIPGVITLNRPKQAAMESLQQGYLNWISWQLAFLLAEQWIGTSLAPSNFDDYWFFRGTAEFAASIGIHQEPSVRNLFASDDIGTPFLRLSYHQGADLAASLMRLFKPGYLLLDEQSLKSRHSFIHQYSYAYFRQVLALRYLHWLYGENFLAALRAFYAENAKQRVSHLDFLEFVKGYPGLVRGSFAAHDILLKWWTASNWPDYSLQQLKVQPHPEDKSSKQLQVQVKQASQLTLPFDVVVTTDRGRRLKKLVLRDEPQVTVSFDLLADEKPDLVEINPGREIYDRNRFDNSNLTPRIRFFPGNADGLADDSYTLIWAPFPSLLPGESLTLNLGLQMFRYVSAGMSGIISYNPAEERLGYSFYYTVDLPSIGAQLSANLVQDYGQTYRDDRVAGLSVSHTPFFLKEPRLALSLRLSFRETLADRNSRHMLGGLRAALSSRRTDHCYYELSAERQQTFGAMGDIDYIRDWTVGELGCGANGVDLNLRGFIGKLRTEGRTTRGIQFNPQSLDEARMRIDRPLLQPTMEFRSLGADLSWPAYLPIPQSFFVLPRQSRWRLSYDYGESVDRADIYTNAGFGFTLPFGGDVVGKTSMSFLNFTVMGIFYRRYADTISYQPGVIFDFLGSL